MREIKQAAIAYLSRREHSKEELRQKLSTKFKNQPGAIEQVLTWLVSQNLQNDTRYCECFVRHRVSQGYGPRRIKSELHQRHIDEDIITNTLLTLAIDWENVLYLRLKKHFGAIDIGNIKNKARVIRHLSARGFDFASITAVINEKIVT